MTSEEASEKIRNLIEDVLRQCGSQKAAALKLGIDEGDFSRRYRGDQGWKIHEIAAMLAAANWTLIRDGEIEALRVMAKIGVHHI